MSFESWLKKNFQYKEIGWKDIGEKFIRYKLFSCQWFNVYLHQLFAPNWHPECHDHPWSFMTILLRRGYLERVPGMLTPETFGFRDSRKRPGQILFRPAKWLHNVITPYGESWSLVITTAKSREWGFRPCERQNRPGTNLKYNDYIGLYG